MKFAIGQQVYIRSPWSTSTSSDRGVIVKNISLSGFDNYYDVELLNGPDKGSIVDCFNDEIELISPLTLLAEQAE
jgi:hypothetical protein